MFRKSCFASFENTNFARLRKCLFRNFTYVSQGSQGFAKTSLARFRNSQFRKNLQLDFRFASFARFSQSTQSWAACWCRQGPGGPGLVESRSQACSASPPGRVTILSVTVYDLSRTQGPARPRRSVANGVAVGDSVSPVPTVSPLARVAAWPDTQLGAELGRRRPGRLWRMELDIIY